MVLGYAGRGDWGVDGMVLDALSIIPSPWLLIRLWGSASYKSSHYLGGCNVVLSRSWNG